MSRPKTCACGEPAARGYHACAACLEAEAFKRYGDFEGRIDVIMLNTCTTVDDLKEWLKEYVLHRPA